MEKEQQIRSGIVWVVSGLLTVSYGGIGLLGYQLPGVEQLVKLLSQVEGWQIYLAASISIFIEGLYFLSSLFPGTTIIMLLAIFSQTFSWISFALTIVFIFIGWCAASFANVWFAKFYGVKVLKNKSSKVDVSNNILISWFPVFRATQEVAEIVAGRGVLEVLHSTFIIKFWASVGATVYLVWFILLFDIPQMNNEEGFISLLFFGIVSIGVGCFEIYKAKKLP
ncbi:MAG: hypothetical protein AAB388_04185 [Patescibacteria group bacterium]